MRRRAAISKQRINAVFVEEKLSADALFAARILPVQGTASAVRFAKERTMRTLHQAVFLSLLSLGCAALLPAVAQTGSATPTGAPVSAPPPANPAPPANPSTPRVPASPTPATAPNNTPLPPASNDPNSTQQVLQDQQTQQNLLNQQNQQNQQIQQNQTMQVQNPVAIGQAFVRADGNHDGSITGAEFSTLGLGSVTFATVDANGDGKISADEWNTYNRAHPAQH